LVIEPRTLIRVSPVTSMLPRRALPIEARKAEPMSVPATGAAVTEALKASSALKFTGARRSTVMALSVTTMSERSAEASATFISSVRLRGSMLVGTTTAPWVSPMAMPACSVTLRPDTLALLTTGLVLVTSLSRPALIEMPSSRSVHEDLARIASRSAVLAW
jgi:hypothetical protein